MEIGTIIFLVIIAVAVFYSVAIYNGLVRGRNAFKNAFSQMMCSLQRRYELIPNLVETAKGYIKHERRDFGSGDPKLAMAPSKPPARQRPTPKMVQR